MGLDNFLGHLLVLWEGLRGGALNFDLVLGVVFMEVGAVGEILAVDLLEEKLTIFHGAEETPESAPADLKLITGLDRKSVV